MENYLNSSVFAIVVSYNPEQDMYVNIKEISSQVDKVIIFDNNSSSLSVLNSCESIENVTVIYSENNIGLSQAQNISISRALSEGAKWIVTFDDDSKISDNYISTMLNFYDDSPIKDNIGVLVPSVFDINSQKCSKFIGRRGAISRKTPCGEPYPILVAISSGMLIKSAVFDVVGKMNEGYFIDYIDIDFCLRVNLFYKIIVLPDVFLLHKLGVKSKVSVLGYDFFVSNHDPIRRYYIYRNRIFVWKSFLLSYPCYVGYDFFVSLLEFAKIISFENKRLKNLSAIFKGILHGVLNKEGKYID